MEGETVGSYRVLRKLGEGGMGVVWLAEHPLIGRQVAVKMLLPELSRNAEIIQRFFNEARSSTLVKHPGIVDIFDFGHHTNGSAYIIMEYLEGESLAMRMKRVGALPIEHAASLAVQIAAVLAAAHARGIVHRDLKPDNIYLCPDGERAGRERVKILDFGIAKLATDGAMQMKTRTGSIMGTPTYMSPEQCRGAGEVDLRSDVYSLACIIYELCSGRPPFVGEGAGELIGMHQFMQPPGLRSFVPSAPPALETLLHRALAKAPKDRPQSMEELARELSAFAAGRNELTWPPPQAQTAAYAQTMAWQAGPSQPHIPAPTPLPHYATGPHTNPQTAPPGQPTTLGGAASEVASYTTPPAGKKSKAGLIIGLVVAAGAAAAIGVVVMNKKSPVTSAASQPEASEPVAPTPTPAPVPPVAKPEPTPEPVAKPEPAPTPAAAPDAGVTVAARPEPPPVEAKPEAKPEARPNKPSRPKPPRPNKPKDLPTVDDI